MESNLRNDDDIIADIKAKHVHYLEDAQRALKQATKYKAMLDAYEAAGEEKSNGLEVGDETIQNEEEQEGQQVGQENMTFNGNPNTFRSGMEKIFLTEDRAMPLNELFQLYQQAGGTLVKDRKTFGVRMAQMKQKGHFNNVTISELPNDIRVWWGIPSFFSGDNLTKEYYAPIRNKYNLTEKIFD